MKCRKCGYEFCWMCLGKWSEHNSSTGGYYQCNIFEKHKDETNKNAKRIETAKQELNRYIFHFERFNNHHKSEKMAREMRPVIHEKISQLNKTKNYPIIELEFLSTSLDVVIKCR
jgi:ariadne-1